MVPTKPKIMSAATGVIMKTWIEKGIPWSDELLEPTHFVSEGLDVGKLGNEGEPSGIRVCSNNEGLRAPTLNRCSSDFLEVDRPGNIARLYVLRHTCDENLALDWINISGAQSGARGVINEVRCTAERLNVNGSDRRTVTKRNFTSCRFPIARKPAQFGEALPQLASLNVDLEPRKAGMGEESLDECLVFVRRKQGPPASTDKDSGDVRRKELMVLVDHTDASRAEFFSFEVPAVPILLLSRSKEQNFGREWISPSAIVLGACGGFVGDAAEGTGDARRCFPYTRDLSSGGRNPATAFLTSGVHAEAAWAIARRKRVSLGALRRIRVTRRSLSTGPSIDEADRDAAQLGEESDAIVD